MKYSTFSFACIAIVLVAIGMLCVGTDGSEMPTPFDCSEPEEPAPQVPFKTSGGHAVEPQGPWNPARVDRAKWPGFPPPTTFNHRFLEPMQVWRVEGGYLASFDAGEFGGALFYADLNGQSWVRVLNTHIQHLERFASDRFLAVGGLAHVIQTGTVNLLYRSSKGHWKAKEVLASRKGVPRISGLSVTKDALKPSAEKLVVVELDYSGSSPVFGVSERGTVYYLGERMEK